MVSENPFCVQVVSRKAPAPAANLSQSQPLIHMPSPLADLPHAHNVGEECFLVTDDEGLVQVTRLHKVLYEDTEGAQVRGLRRQHLEHALLNIIIRIYIGGNSIPLFNYMVSYTFTESISFYATFSGF